jgi:hypothetical protein
LGFPSEEDVQEFQESFAQYFGVITAEEIAALLAGKPRLFESLVAKETQGHSSFKMDDGSLGLGPSFLREGDVIIELAGGHAPFASRPRGEGYLLLGSVYVDGITYGESTLKMRDKRQRGAGTHYQVYFNITTCFIKEIYP